MHTLPSIYFCSNSTLKILMDPDQAHRKLVKAAYDAAKAKTEAANSKRKEAKVRMKLGDQSSCLFFITYEGN